MLQNQATAKAAIYARRSPEDRANRQNLFRGEGVSDSIESQRMMLRRYAEQNSLYVVDEYIDDGYSGTNFNRPNFQRMIGDIEAGRINCVVVKDDCVIIELNAESPIQCGFCAVSSIF